MTKAASPELIREIKMVIMEAVEITDVDPDEVDDNEPLFAEDNAMGLDSIDAISIIVALQKKYEVHIDDQNLSRVVLQSVNTVANFIAKESRVAGLI